MLLNNALQQTGSIGEPLTLGNWQEAIRNRLGVVDWDRVVADVGPFLGPSADLNLLNRDNLMRLLG